MQVRVQFGGGVWGKGVGAVEDRATGGTMRS